MSEPSRPPRKERPIVSAHGIAKIYSLRRGLLGHKKQLVHALAGASVDIHEGETLGVVGESGSGKTTLGRALIRLLEPTFGRIELDGKDITRLSDRELRPHRRRMQIVFQDPYSSLDPRMTIRDVIAEGLDHFKIAKGSDREHRTAEMAGRVGLALELLDRYPHELSGGQRQRVAIARALAVGPAFVVCDEPTSALDVSIAAQIVNLLEDLQHEQDLAYLFISHDLRTVRQTSHRIAVMYLGRIVEIGPAAMVAERRLHPYTQALFAAAPQIGPRREPRRLLLAGEPPHPSSPPSGCAFHPRCPIAEKGVCDAKLPELEVLDDERHLVACFKAEAGPAA